MIAACYLMSLGIYFIGLSYLVVYVGAVAVLFLFVVMILNVRISEVVSAGREYTKGLPLGFTVSLLFLYEVLQVVDVQMTSVASIISTVNSFFLTSTYSGVANYVHITFSYSAIDTVFIDFIQVQALGFSLYTYNTFSLILVAVVLLLSIMGPISLCLNTRTNE